MIENRKNINKKCPNNEGEGTPEEETLKKIEVKKLAKKEKN